MVDKFLDYLEVEKRYSPHTISSYKKDLQNFSDFYLEEEAQSSIVTAEKIHIRILYFTLERSDFLKDQSTENFPVFDLSTTSC